MANVDTVEITSLLPGFDNYGPPIDPRINTEETSARARKRLEKCLREHERCYDRSKQTATPPSRLLDVRQEKTRLVSTRYLKNPTWAALSYCWGGPQEAQTTHLNVRKRYQEIRLEDLPLTIRDGIHVCRQMHIPYLWVDSLCIIQTDSTSTKGGKESDKDRELRKMAGIFSGAVLTISASCASSATDGFLQDRQVLPPGIALPVRVNDIYDIAQVVRIQRDSFQFAPEPVDSRAWILQEQRLSRNTLNFRKQAMQWGCLSSGTCFSLHDEYAFQRCRIDGYELGWHALVEEYTKRNISNAEDRPVAISAVAESFVGTGREDTYLAGMWSNSLLGDLLWSVSWLPDDNCNHDNKATKIEGPSWSWTTILRPISYGYDRWYQSGISRFTAEINMIPRIDLVDPCFTFGPAKSGKITIKGLITRNSERLPQREEGSLRCVMDQGNRPQRAYLLELATDGMYERLGLILRKAPREEAFERIGIFSQYILGEYMGGRKNPCLWHDTILCKKCICRYPPGRCIWTCDRDERDVVIL